MASAEPAMKDLSWSRYSRAELIVLFSARAWRCASSSRADDGLQPAGVFQRHGVACALLHRCADDVLVDLIARDQHWHVGAELLADGHDFRRVGRVGADERDQHVRIDLRERVAQIVQLADPVAADRVAGVAQGAVDGFDVVLMTGQDDHRHGALFGQVSLQESG